MYSIDLVVTLEEPGIFAAGHQAGNLVETLPYVPGNVLLGALAERFLYELKGSSVDPRFRTFFLSDAVRFEHLYPCDNSRVLRATTPIPLSTLTCKDYPRPCSETEENRLHGDGHPYHDFLLDTVAPKCAKSDCDAPLTGRDGFYYTLRTPGGETYDYRVQPVRIVRMHNTIDDESQRPSEGGGGVFAYECLDRQQCFRGLIGFSDGATRDEFGSTVFGAEREIELGLGRGRGRGGYGEATVRVLALESTDGVTGLLDKGDFERRWDLFRTAKGRHFTITLHSDTIVADRYLRYQTTLTEPVLAAELGVPEDALKRHAAFSVPCTADGFSGIHGLPLETEIAVSRGSAFLFEVMRDEVLDTVKKGLRKLEEEGMGFRRNQGFGRLIVCDGYHLRCRPGINPAGETL